jgi:hypothetical protein
MSFTNEVAFLRSTDMRCDDMISIYRRRDSCIQALFEGVVLVPARRVDSELTYPTFSFVPHESQRRLVRWGEVHFLGGRLRKLAQLEYNGRGIYLDSANKVAATRIKSQADSFDRKSEIELRLDILKNYCASQGFAAFWVTDSYRFSERSPEEYDLPVGRVDISGDRFCYFHRFGQCDQAVHFRMRTVSLLCGKRLVVPHVLEQLTTNQ